MISRMFIAITLIFLLSLLWVKFQEAGRRFARKHPEFGRYREEGGECGKTCGCADWKHCAKRSEVRSQRSGASHPPTT